MRPIRLKLFVVPLLFLGIPISMLMIQPVNPAPSDSLATDALSNNESPGGPTNWFVAPVTLTATAPGKGRRLFLRDCARCHGEHGDGVSLVADTLHPRPFDLTSFELTDSFILRVLREGVPGSDMPAWPVSSDVDLRTVAAYTARLARPDALPAQEHYAPPEALQEAGRRIYVMHCTGCHGENGSGDGPEAGRYLPMPASFSEMRPSYAAAKHVIENGVHGTAMPAWPLLTSAEIQAVTFYIRTLYAGPESATGAHP